MDTITKKGYQEKSFFFILLLFFFFLPLFYYQQNQMFFSFFILLELVLVLSFLIYSNKLTKRIGLTKVIIGLGGQEILFTLFNWQKNLKVMIFLGFLIVMSSFFLLGSKKIFKEINSQKMDVLQFMKGLIFFCLFVQCFKMLQINIKSDFNSLSINSLYFLLYNLVLLILSCLMFLNCGLIKKDLGLSYFWSKKNLFKSLFLFFVGCFLIFIQLNILKKFNFHFPVFSIKTYRIFVYQFILYGFPEEFLFRGILYFLIKRIALKYRFEENITSILFSSLLFAIFHWNFAPVYFINYLIGGFLLGIIRIMDKNIYVCSLLHALFNTFS